MNARLLRAEAGKERSWFEWIRADGTRAGLQSGLLDMVGDVANQEEFLAANSDYTIGSVSRARQLLDVVTSAAVEDRVRAIEDRLTGTVFGPPEMALVPELDVRDQQNHGLLESHSIDRIAANDLDGGVIGRALIGDAVRNVWLPVAHDAAILRAGNTWRKLPVGCLVLEHARRPEMAIVGESVIEPGVIAEDGTARAAAGDSRRPKPSPAPLAAGAQLEPVVERAVR